MLGVLCVVLGVVYCMSVGVFVCECVLEHNRGQQFISSKTEEGGGSAENELSIICTL